MYKVQTECVFNMYKGTFGSTMVFGCMLYRAVLLFCVTENYMVRIRTVVMESSTN